MCLCVSSSDACSSELVLVIVPPSLGAVTTMLMAGAAPTARLARVQVTTPPAWLQLQPLPAALTKVTPRSEERRVGTEGTDLWSASLTSRVHHTAPSGV